MSLIFTSALGFTPATHVRTVHSHVRTVHSTTVARPAVVMMDSPWDRPREFNFGKIFDGIKSGMDDMMKGDTGDVADIDEYCRDDESTGCDLDMLAQVKAKEALQEPGIKLETEWTAEIDAAVKSSAPEM